MKHLFLPLFFIIMFSGCSIVNQKITINKTKKQILEAKILSLSNTIDKKEAQNLSFEAIEYSKKLAKEYGVTTSALFHNTLINLNIKSRGLCYHYTNDLLKHLRKKNYKSFKFKKIVANKNEYFEHSSLIVTTKKTSFKNSIVLDAWRYEGELFFSKVKDDKKYNWEIR